MTVSNKNKKFYDKYADSWDQTRDYFWEGWELAWKYLSPIINYNKQIDIHDIGCGNGRLSEFYHSKLTDNQIINTNYLGYDISIKLLEKAKKRIQALKPKYNLYKLTNLDINDFKSLQNTVKNQDMCIINLIAVTHHIESSTELTLLLEGIINIANKYKQSIIIISNWQFLENEKIKNKLRKINENYYELDWKGNYNTPRTLHYHTDSEISEKFSKNDYNKLAQYRADGYNNYLIFSN